MSMKLDKTFKRKKDAKNYGKKMKKKGYYYRVFGHYGSWLTCVSKKPWDPIHGRQ